MSETIKQMYVSLEIGQNDIKLLAAEYYHTRFNVLRVEKYPTDTISDFKVMDEEKLVDDLKKAVQDFSNKVGGTIQKVILVLPAYNFKKISLKSRIYPNNGVITKTDICRAVSNSLNTKVDNDVMVINSLITKYIVNGLPTKRMPENEACDDIVVCLDLLCADKQLAFDYVSAVEKAGIKVLDITLNTYSICKDASLFEESLKNILILLDIEKDVTFISLLNKGKIVSSEVLFEGLNTICEEVKKTYPIRNDDLLKLVKFNIDFNSQYMDDVIHSSSNENGSLTITTKQLNEASSSSIDELGTKLIEMCRPLLENGASIVVTGEGIQCKALIDDLAVKANNNLKTYYPDTIGVRDPSLTGLYGSLVAYKEKAVLNDFNVDCIDLLEFDTNMNENKFDSEGETITTKIKNLFRQYMKGEE